MTAELDMCLIWKKERKEKECAGQGKRLLAADITAIRFVRRIHKVEANVPLCLWPQCDFDDYPKIEYNDLTDRTTVSVCVCVCLCTSECDQWNRGGSADRIRWIINSDCFFNQYYYLSVLVSLCVCVCILGIGVRVRDVCGIIRVL